ncbi:MAG: outer membrane beta-barrel protein [Candidatus Korobacteraceae bacterium]
MKNSRWIFVVAVVLLLTITAFSQEYPKFEVPVGFSFINVHPDLSPITSFNMFGGGGGFVYNVSSWIGIKADFGGYTQGSGLKNQLTNLGYAGQANGNVFTYMFGPQIKKHSGKLQPFGEALFGAAHSNLYTQLYDAQTGLVSASSNNNAFAMEFGGGLDFALTPHIQLRPVEVDYLYTRFGINGTSYAGSQSNFKYFAGINFTFGAK